MATKDILPLHFRRFLKATQDWTDEEVGCYMRLLIHQWGNDVIPEETDGLKQIAKSVEKNYWIIEKKFKNNGNGLQNTHMEEIREELKEFKKNQKSIYFKQLKKVFMDKVGEEYYFSDKDGFQLKNIEKKILHLFKLKNQVPTEKQVIEAWQYLLENVKNKFVLENFTVPIINSKWNEIIKDLKKQKNGSRTEKLERTLSEIDRKVAEQFASNAH